jgi:hypothetical protein
MSLRMRFKQAQRIKRKGKMHHQPELRKPANVQKKSVKDRVLKPKLTTKRPSRRAQMGQRPTWR